MTHTKFGGFSCLQMNVILQKEFSDRFMLEKSFFPSFNFRNFVSVLVNHADPTVQSFAQSKVDVFSSE